MKRIILILLTILMGVTMAAVKKILVAYYSRADENYGVGTITKGYDDCINVAKKELVQNEREKAQKEVDKWVK